METRVTGRELPAGKVTHVGVGEIAQPGREGLCAAPTIPVSSKREKTYIKGRASTQYHVQFEV